MKKTIPAIVLTAALTLLLSTLFFVFYYIPNANTAAGLTNEDVELLKKLHTVDAYIEKHSIFEFDREEAVDNAILYYLTGLEDELYAAYFTKEELEQYNTELVGNFIGIGINVISTSTILENGLYIYRVLGNSPAEQAGIMTGDTIIEADGVSFIDLPYEDALDILLDEEGTTVNIKVDRNGAEKEFTVTRKSFEQRNVEYNVYDEIGYIRIHAFEQNADEQFGNALTALLKLNIKGLVIDVRNNPGGELNTVCNIIDMLVPGNEEIIVIQYKDRENIIHSTDRRITDIPCVVLTNNSSASGSELLASSCRDILGSKIVGERTFGKGVGQTTFSLYDGSGLKLTTFRYLTKSRTDYNNIGLEPDYLVTLDEKWDMEFYTMTFEDDIQLQKAISVLSQEIRD